jgi:hypothetical protein
MQFDKLVESVVGKMDGRREVYNITIHVAERPNIWCRHWTRQTDRGVEHLDGYRKNECGEHINILYDGPDISQVFQALDAFIPQHSPFIQSTPLEFKYILRDQFQDIPVVYTVVDSSYYTHEGTVFIYAEVDTGKLRAQQIRNNLKDADTSGLEDLL